MPRPRTVSDGAILAATARTIGRNGLARLTLSMVAREAGLSPAALVQRFGSKRGLLLALAEQAEPGARAPFIRARESPGSPLAVLHAALLDLAGSVRSRDELANHLSFLQLDLTDPRFRHHAATHARIMREEIAALLADAVAAGELTEDVDGPRLAGAVQVTYNGSLISWALAEDGRPLAGALAADLDYLLAPYRPGTTGRS